jgi:aminopeptidase
MKTFSEQLDDYASLMIKVGVNLQAGQRLMIRAPIESADLVQRLTACAYRIGCPLVSVIYHDEQLSLARFQHAPKGSFENFPEWEADALLQCAKRGDAFIRISASDPDLLREQSPEDISTAMRSAQKHLAEYMKYPMSDAVAWLVASVPIPAWAKKVFPGNSPEKAMEQLWKAIFQSCRIEREDPVDAWNTHLSNLETRANHLNRKAFRFLHYRGQGTDLKIGLPTGHIWKSGRSRAKSGVPFVANLPTEEVFTLGDRNHAEGWVRSTKPLHYGGTLIENFALHFKNGKVDEIRAEKGLETLRKLVETDDGASRIGEVALVPHGSPISQSGVLFYNTLFDENASSHLALGRAYRFNLEGGKEMSDQSFTRAGGNDSLVHVDFMIGDEQLDIDGITADGNTEALMRLGEWVD